MIASTRRRMTTMIEVSMLLLSVTWPSTVLAAGDDEEGVVSQVKRLLLTPAEDLERERRATLARAGAKPDPRVALGASRTRNVACRAVAQPEENRCIIQQLNDLCVIFEESAALSPDDVSRYVVDTWARTVPSAEALRALREAGSEPPDSKYRKFSDLAAQAGAPSWSCDSLFERVLTPHVTIDPGTTDEAVHHLIRKHTANLRVAIHPEIRGERILRLLEIIAAQNLAEVKLKTKNEIDEVRVRLPDLRRAKVPRDRRRVTLIGRIRHERPEEKAAGLSLVVAVTRNGFIIAARGGVLPSEGGKGPTIPHTRDQSALYRKVAAIKEAFPDNDELTVVADADADWSTIRTAFIAATGARFERLYFGRLPRPAATLLDSKGVGLAVTPVR